MIRQAYINGFMSKCAEYGVPEQVAGRMLKAAQESKKVPTPEYLGWLAMLMEGKQPRGNRFNSDGSTMSYDPAWFLPRSKGYQLSIAQHASGMDPSLEKKLTDAGLYSTEQRAYTPAGTNYVNDVVSSYSGKTPTEAGWRLIDFANGKIPGLAASEDFDAAVGSGESAPRPEISPRRGR